MQEPIDFTLQDQDDQPFAFDARLRARVTTCLVFYRGSW